jgi:hypothetical protein
MTDKDKFSERLATNLKALNAKERDHLMRFAYLGEDGTYEKSTTFLSEEFLNLLGASLGNHFPKLTKESCLFAGMDYHLNWFYAAMHLTGIGFEDENGMKEGGKGKRKVGIPDAPEKTGLHPVLGNQEDIDLLVVLKAGGKVHVVFVEAKGASGFDRTQLARKLVRVNHIIDVSKPKGGWSHMDFHFVLAPGRENNRFDESTFEEYLNAGGVPSEGEEKAIHEEACRCREFNQKPIWLKVNNFPDRDFLWKVTRTRIGNASDGPYTHWKLEKR